MSRLLHAIQTAATVTDRVLVAFSGGKDSIVTLDLCMKHFKHVEVFFMYQVKGLAFQEATLRHYEKRYGITIHRIPHFEMSQFLRYGVFSAPDPDVPIVSCADMHWFMRGITGEFWIASGERIADSFVRRTFLKESGTLDHKIGRIYPVAEWKKAEILAYIRQHQLFLGPETRVLGFSFQSLRGAELAKIRDKFPDDFARICRVFPLAEASIKKVEYGNQ